MPLQVSVNRQAIAEFCRRWQVTELGVFGSVTGPHMRPESDIDVFVTFAPDADISLFDLATMKDELTTIFGRSVDLGEKACLKPLIRRKALETSEVLFAA